MNKDKLLNTSTKAAKVVEGGIKNGWSRLLKLKSTTQEKISDKAIHEYENIQGGTEDRFPSRELVVDEGFEQSVKEMGAIFDEDKQKWMVPEGRDLEEFQLFWPEIPSDLRTPTRRKLLTKHGQVREAYVHPEDECKGGDSLALPLMYGFLVALSAISFFLIKNFESFGVFFAFPFFLLSIPYAVSIGSSEGMKEGVKCWALLYLAPIALGTSLFFNNGAATYGTLGEVGTYLSAYLIFITLLGFHALFFYDAENSDELYKAAMGSKKDFFIGAWKFATFVLLVMLTATIVPEFTSKIPVLKYSIYLKPFAFYFLASIYPLYYVNNDKKLRGIELNEQKRKFNLGQQGSLANAGEAAKLSQIRKAYEDPTPTIELGVAVGVTERKHYHNAPSARAILKASLRDLSTHFCAIGASGTGKTGRLVRSITKQFHAKGKDAIGMLILCGKGTLASELMRYLDIVVKRGIRFAPFQGLNAAQTFIALTENGMVKAADAALKNESNKDFWEGGGHNLCKHALTLLEALIESEKDKARANAEEYSIKEEQILHVQLELELAKREDGDIEYFQTELNRLNAELEELEVNLTTPRQFYWTPWNLNLIRNEIKNVIPGPSQGAEGGGNFPNKQLIEYAELLGVEFEYNDEGMITNVRTGTCAPFANFETKREGSPLNLALNYALDTYPDLTTNYTSAYNQNFERLINPLLEGKFLCDASGVFDEEGNELPGKPWHMTETGIDVMGVLKGKKCSVDMPELMYGPAAILIQSLVRSKIYNGIKLRRKGWEQEEKAVAIVMDEAQLLVGAEEIKVADVFRSQGGHFFTFSQSINSFINAFGNESMAKKFLDSHKTFVIFQADIDTYNYFSKRVGVAELTKFTQRTIGLDYHATASLVANEISNDLNHPNIAVSRYLEKKGAGSVSAFPPVDGSSRYWAGAKSKRSRGKTLRSGITAVSGGKREIDHVFKPEDCFTYLRDGYAMIHLNRAGTMMADVIKLDFIDENGKVHKSND